MLCAGQAILAGMPQDYVLATCGPPTSARQVVYAMFAGSRVIDVWSYAQTNEPTHEVHFENGVVISVDQVYSLGR